MARLNERPNSITQRSVAESSNLQQRSSQQPSPSPSDLAGSDKENTSRGNVRSNLGKRKSISVGMATPQPPDTSAPSKRRRLEEKGKERASQGGRSRGNQVDTETYDPDQDEATKRENTRKLRQLHADLNDSRAEYLQRGSRGLQNTLREADEIFKDVKQTSTATIDSRLLVNVGDLAYKKINSLTLGDSSTTIDVDDFLTKCISYMRSTPGGASTQPSSTQRRRQQRQNNNEDEDQEDDVELNWSHFGQTLCFPASSRPCLSSFLLGPLSVQKKIRAPTQRRATQRANADGTQTTRPAALDEEALDRNEAASLTQVCSEIAALLSRTQAKGEKLVDEQGQRWEEEGYEPSDEEVRSLMRKYNMSSNGGVPMFNFCLNPKSFGQTVENFFYISFLIKEGKIGLAFDDDGMPTLGMVEAKTLEERQESVRNQAVFKLDFDVWEDLVQSCGLEKCVIPHRHAEAYEEDDGVLRRELASRRRREEIRTSNVPQEGSPTYVRSQVVESEDMYGLG